MPTLLAPKPPAWTWHPERAGGNRAILAKLCLIAPIWREQPGQFYAIPSGAGAGNRDGAGLGIPGYEMSRFGVVQAASNVTGCQSFHIWRRGADRLSGATGVTLMYLASATSGGVAFENWAYLGASSGSYSTAVIQVGSAALKVQGAIRTGGGTTATGDSGTLTQDAWYWFVLRWASGQVVRLDIYNVDGTTGPAGAQSGAITNTLSADSSYYYRHGGPHHRAALLLAAPSRLTDTDVQTILDAPFAFLQPLEPDPGPSQLAGPQTVTLTTAAAAATANAVTVAPGAVSLTLGTAAATAAARDVAVGVLGGGTGQELLGRPLTWGTTDGTKIAAPASGVSPQTVQVTLLAAGTASLQATCETVPSNVVPVSIGSVAAVASALITASPTNAGQVGALLTFTAVAKDAGGNALPGRAVGWSVTAASVASWDAGHGSDNPVTVVCRSIGTCDIQAWCAGIGSNVITVTVTAADIPVTRVQLTPVSLSGQVGGTGTLTATVYGGSTTLASRRAATLAYLQGLNTGTTNRVLIGQDLNYNPSTLAYLNDVITQTGKAPAVAGVPAFWSGNADQTSVALAAANLGYLVTMGCWWTNPQTGGDQHDMTITFHDLLVAGATRTAWFALLDTVATRLTQMKNAGHVVLFRPFVEINGNWFWWSCPTKASGADFAAVWIEMYDYLMTTKGLADCLLWCYNVYAGSGNYTTGYPGDAYVDLVGFDYYGDTPGTGCGSTYTALQAKPKPIYVAEFGSHGADWTTIVPNTYDNSRLITDVRTYLPNCVIAAFWAYYWSIRNQNGASTLMNDAWSVSRDELPPLGGEQVLTGRAVTHRVADPTIASVT